MLHPLRVVAVGEVLAGVGAAAFLAVGGGVHRGGGLDDEVLEFERLDQVSVPDHAAIGDADVGDAGDHFGDTLDAGLKRLPGTEDGAVFLHGALHGGAEFRRGG